MNYAHSFCVTIRKKKNWKSDSESSRCLNLFAYKDEFIELVIKFIKFDKKHFSRWRIQIQNICVRRTVYAVRELKHVLAALNVLSLLSKIWLIAFFAHRFWTEKISVSRHFFFPFARSRHKWLSLLQFSFTKWYSRFCVN